MKIQMCRLLANGEFDLCFVPNKGGYVMLFIQVSTGTEKTCLRGCNSSHGTELRQLELLVFSEHHGAQNDTKRFCESLAPPKSHGFTVLTDGPAFSAISFSSLSCSERGSCRFLGNLMRRLLGRGDFGLTNWNRLQLPELRELQYVTVHCGFRPIVRPKTEQLLTCENGRSIAYPAHQCDVTRPEKRQKTSSS